MTIGALRHFATINVPVTGRPDSLGDKPIQYVPSGGNVWCAIEPLTASERWYAMQVRADATHKVTCRTIDAGLLTAKCRVTWNGRTWEMGPRLSEDERGVYNYYTAVEIQ